MDWIKTNGNKDIPSKYFANRDILLLKDADGMVGVGYWNSYDWVLHLSSDIEIEICFSDIVEYCEFK